MKLSQKALDASGYKHKLKYEKIDIHSLNKNGGKNKKNRNRKRRIFWFNPPWDSRVSSDVGAKFLRILDRTIPRGHPLHKLFNHHTVKVSYRCLGNMGKKISIHNQRIFSEYTTEKKRVEQHYQQHRENWNQQVARQQQRRPRGHHADNQPLFLHHPLQQQPLSRTATVGKDQTPVQWEETVYMTMLCTEPPSHPWTKTTYPLMMKLRDMWVRLKIGRAVFTSITDLSQFATQISKLH